MKRMLRIYFFGSYVHKNTSLRGRPQLISCIWNIEIFFTFQSAINYSRTRCNCFVEYREQVDWICSSIEKWKHASFYDLRENVGGFKKGQRKMARARKTRDESIVDVLV